MEKPEKRQEEKTNIRALAMLLIPILVVSLSGFGYVSLSGQTTETLEVEDIAITGYTLVHYNGFGFDIEWDENVFWFNDTLIFPDWELKLVLNITNVGTSPLQIRYQIDYWDGTSWTQTDEAGLLTMFGLVYTDGFYLGPGEDGIWNTEDDVPMPAEHMVAPEETVYKVEHLLFDVQERPELQNQTFMLQIEIMGSAVR